jgi:hypothetical protein
LSASRRSHWYILELGKGFAFHSKEFNQGYIDGFGSVDPSISSNADEATLDCKQAAPGVGQGQGDLIDRSR